MRLLSVTSILIATAGLCQSQADVSTVNADQHWCGPWAGSPNPADVPSEQLLPGRDDAKRFFVEPQLQRVPFSPVQSVEPKVQVPKIWGTSAFYLVPRTILFASL